MHLKTRNTVHSTGQRWYAKLHLHLIEHKRFKIVSESLSIVHFGERSSPPTAVEFTV